MSVLGVFTWSDAPWDWSSPQAYAEHRERLPLDPQPSKVTRLQRLIHNYLAVDLLDPIATIAFCAAAEKMQGPFDPACEYVAFLPDDGYWRHWYEGRGAI